MIEEKLDAIQTEIKKGNAFIEAVGAKLGQLAAIIEACPINRIGRENLLCEEKEGKV